MRHLLNLLLPGALASLALVVNAQTPEAFRYQAVARDGGGQLVVNTAVGVQFQLHSGSTSGPVVYAETHNPTTNAQGLFTVAVGEGTPTSGTFSSIQWSVGTYFVEVGLDPAGGTAYSTIGVQQLLSVPYALQAKEAAHASASDTAAYALSAGPAGTAAGDIRYWNGSSWVILPLGPSGQQLTSCAGTLQWGYCSVQQRLNGGETPCQIANSGVPLDSLWGKSYIGGLIAYLDPSTCQGIVASPLNSSVPRQWMSGDSPWFGCPSDLVGNTSTALFTGVANCSAIDALLGCSINIRYWILADPAFISGGWTAPSRDDLAMLYTNLHLNGYGGFIADPNTFYWSSSEYSNTQAYRQSFHDGGVSTAFKEDYYHLRGVKYF